MIASRRFRPLPANFKNSRSLLVLLVVFLLMVGLAGRLFYLAVFEHDYYLALAADQQTDDSRLEPTRGKIYFQDKSADTGDGLFAVASTKELMTIYVVPAQVTDADKLAQAVYDFFDQTNVEAQADKDLAAPLSTTTTTTPSLAVAAQRQQLIDQRRQALLDKYHKLLAKPNDPYESLEKRVDPGAAKKFQLTLLDKSQLPADLTSDDLDFSGTTIVSRRADVKNSQLAFAGVGYSRETYRVYPENNVASQLLGYVSLEPEFKNDQFGRHGHYGLEGFFDDELFGQFGEVKSDRGAGGLIIAADRQYTAPVNGDNLLLTIDRTIQFRVDQVIKDGVIKYAADSGSAILLDPNTGAVLAMSSYPNFDPNNYNQADNPALYNNPAVFDDYEPGSVFKAMTMAAALNEGKVTSETTYNDSGQVTYPGSKPIKNSDFATHGGHGITTMTQVLEYSLNTGAIFAMRSMGAPTLASYAQKFGFGEKTGIELEGESSGDIKLITGKSVREVNAATASFGQGITVTPIQLAVAYAAIANGGRLIKPYVVQEIQHADGTSLKTEPQAGKLILQPKTANILSGMLVNVVESGHAKGASVAGYYIAGKTGTAEIANKGKAGYIEGAYNHTFIAFAPADKPRFVLLVRFKNPKGIVYAESTAVPVAHDIMAFVLNYWQVPKER